MAKNSGSTSPSGGHYEPLLEVFDKSAVSKDPGDANPDERDGPYLLSSVQGAMMIFKFCVGAGLFSLPAAFRYSGVAVGVIWVFLCGALTTFGMQRLVESSWEVSRRRGTKTSYFGDIGAACGSLFSEKWEFVGRLAVDISLSIAAFCLLCPMEMFVSDIWRQAFEDHDLVNVDISVWILVVFSLLLPTTFIRRPDILALCSLIANIFEAVVIISVFVHIFSTTSSWTLDNTVDWRRMPLTMGIAFYAFEIAPFILSVENVTRKPKNFARTINIVMGCVSCIYALIGSVGYMSCFPKCADSFILNLPSSWYYSVVKFLVGCVGMCSSVLVSFVVYNVVEPILKVELPENRFYLVSLLHRIFVLAASCAITASVPQLANITSLAGSLVTGTIGFLLPVLSHTLLLYNRLSRFTFATNVIFAFCGLLVLTSGVYTSLENIIYDYY